MCGNVFGRSNRRQITADTYDSEPTYDEPSNQPEVVQAPAPTDSGAAGVNPPGTTPQPVPSTATAARAGLDALDNSGVKAGEADVSVTASGDDAELDPSTGRRRPTRASFMSSARGGAGLKV